MEYNSKNPQSFLTISGLCSTLMHEMEVMTFIIINELPDKREQVRQRLIYRLRTKDGERGRENAYAFRFQWVHIQADEWMIIKLPHIPTGQ